MSRYAKIIARWFGVESEKGVTAIEYGLIASLIAVVIIAAVTLIGTNLNTVFGKISAQLK
jgi:pilus assembly protein Flp/PilA